MKQYDARRPGSLGRNGEKTLGTVEMRMRGGRGVLGGVPQNKTEDTEKCPGEWEATVSVLR